MGITFSVSDSNRLVRARAEGPISLDDIRAHIEEERLAGGLPHRELIDGRGATPAFTSEEVRSVVAILRQLGNDSRLGPTAVLVDSQVGYGMLRMFEALLDDVCAVRPFYRQDEAEQWLAGFSENTA
jgi:hypothetical protein